MWSVVAYTDEPIAELGLEVVLRADSEFDLICVCRSREEFIRAAELHKPNLLLYGLAADANLTVALELRRVAPQSEQVVWSREVSTELAHRALEIGVRGFVCTSAQPATFRECLRIAAGGKLWMENSLSMSLLNNRPINLSRRQSQLVGLLVQGLKNKEIATSLGISEGTVKAYLTTLFEKVGAKDRFELALFGLKNLRHLHTAEDEETPNLPSHLRSLVAPSPAAPSPTALSRVGRRPERNAAAFSRQPATNFAARAGGRPS